MRNLLVLGAGRSQLGLLAATRNRGVTVTACDRDPGAPGFKHADRRAIVPVDDEPAIQRLAEAENIDGVIAPGDDWTVGVAARVAERLALPHPLDVATAVLSTSKLRQRERFAEAGVPTARWQLSTDLESEVRFPVVVRAADRQRLRGVSVVRAWDELRPALELAASASRSGVCIVEELIDGPEVTVQGFSVAGELHVLYTNGPGDGVAAGELAASAAAAIGVREGPSYTQLRLAADGLRVVELSARVAATDEADLCRRATGIDPNGLALAAALGDSVRFEPDDGRVRYAANAA